MSNLYKSTNKDFNKGSKFAFEFTLIMLNNDVFDREDVIKIINKQLTKIEEGENK